MTKNSCTLLLSNLITGSTPKLEASKSESNRVLLLETLCPPSKASEITNISKARDSQIMQSLLATRAPTWDVKDAGTTMRFLTAYLAVVGQGEIITGTTRMQKRPIALLVDSLRSLGATIEYIHEEGYPPLRIHKVQHQSATKVNILGNVSSQYISALFMIAPTLEKGLSIQLKPPIYSRPYLEMTLSLMKKFGVEVKQDENNFQIKSGEYKPCSYHIENDWSGASYWFGFVALSKSPCEIHLEGLRKNSYQGDSAIVDIMSKMGVSAVFGSGAVTLKHNPTYQRTLQLNFKDCPDLAQTVMVVAAVKGISLFMEGLESLKIKETDRVMAMQKELKKIGATLKEEGARWTLIPSTMLPEKVEVATYEDHRMAMAFAPLALHMNVVIHDPDVVRKSYPNFWKEVEKVGVTIK